MHSQYKDNQQAILKQLWGRNVPPLTSEEVELSLKVWQKIAARKQRQKSSETTANKK